MDTIAAGRGSQPSQAAKRAHTAVDGDDVHSMAADARDGWTIFNSRYGAKRARRGKHNSQPGLSSSQPTQPRPSTRSQAKPQQSDRVLKMMDDVIESVATQSPSPSPSEPKSQSGESESMKQDSSSTGNNNEMRRLRQQVSVLQQQVDFLLSFLGIAHNKAMSSADNNGINNANNPSQTTPTYASAASVLPMGKLQGPIRNALLTAVHSDLQLKQSRNTHIVVTGLPSDMESSDEEIFTELCEHEFGMTPVVERTQRLGKQSADRYQPLLVVLTTTNQAERLLTMAKCLRASTDVYTSTHVFFAPHQTQAERQAAYETRCRRREARERRAAQQNIAGDISHHQQPPLRSTTDNNRGFPRDQAEPTTQPTGEIESSSSHAPVVAAGVAVATNLTAAVSHSNVPSKDQRTGALASTSATTVNGKSSNMPDSSNGSTLRVDVPVFTPTAAAAAAAGATGAAAASDAGRAPDSGSCS